MYKELTQKGKPKSNLTPSQRKGLSYLKGRKDLSITPFDKGQGFVTIETPKLIEKAEAEFKNTALDTPNKTTAYEGKIQRKLRQLHKDGKLDDKTYRECYPSGSLTPSASVAIEAHKPTKKGRVIINHIESPQEKLASNLKN